ncbi:Uncharacterised protein [Bordetella pertussis]|nr:Uncharacterised protein [Bordetella pertussis]
MAPLLSPRKTSVPPSTLTVDLRLLSLRPTWPFRVQVPASCLVIVPKLRIARPSVPSPAFSVRLLLPLPPFKDPVMVEPPSSMTLSSPASNFTLPTMRPLA